jgi:prolycopene isomerase
LDLSTPASGRYDCIVIGAGLAGLTAAAALAHRGLRIALLERGEGTGGYAKAFKRGPYTFDPAIHLAAECGDGELMDVALRNLGVRDRVTYRKTDAFYEARFPGLALRVPADAEAYYDVHARAFPAEAKGLREFLRVCTQMHGEAHQLPPRIGMNELDAMAARFPTVFRYQKATAYEVMDSFLTDPKLKAALLAIFWASIGTRPSEFSFLTFAQYLSVQVQGTYFAEGGFQTLVDALSHAVVESGGDLRVQCPVTRILVENGRVAGVEVEGGDRLRADHVIAAADARTVLERMVGAEHLPGPYLKRLAKMRPTLSAVTLFGATKRDLRAEGATHGTFMYEDWDPELSWSRILAGEPAMTWMTVPTLVDPTLAPPGEHVAMFVCPASYQTSEPWPDKRERFARRMVEFSEQAFPGLGGDLEIFNVGTPTTLERYTGNEAGAMSGWAATPNQTGSRRLPIRTPIDGLYLAGHWTQPGQGSLRMHASGFWAAHYVLDAVGAERYKLPMAIQGLW